MPETKLRQFRIDDALVKRLDRYAKHLSKENPCFLVNRTSTLRHILIKHLEQWENEDNARTRSAHKSKR